MTAERAHRVPFLFVGGRILSAKLPPLLVSIWSEVYLCPLLKLLHSLDAYLPQIAAKS